VGKRLALGFFVLALCAGWPVIMPPAIAAESDASAGASGAGGDLATIVHRLQRHYQETSSFDANFTESIASAGGARRDRSGTLKYRRPGRMRWDFAPPQEETIVSDGTTLYVYEPDLNQVVEAPLEHAFRTSAPAALLLGMGDIERDFVASMPSAPATDHLVHLALKGRADGTRVALALDPATYDIRDLTVADELGNVTRLVFSGLRMNISLDDALFRFKAPDGADVVTAPASP
jgi:outer membrane lipoprotein carrier protein